MESLGSFYEALWVFGVVIVALGLLEWLLYGLYTYHNHKLFLFISSLIGAGIGTTLALDDSSRALPIGAAVGLVTAAFFKYVVKGRQRFAALMIAPAFVSIAALVIYPFFFELRLAMARLNMYTVNRWITEGELGWAGFENFYNVFTSSPLQTATFWELLARTLLWTAINVFFHVLFGLLIALLLNKNIKGKGWYRTLLIVPWAMPQVVAVLAWRGEFHPTFGFVNHLLGVFSISPINWWSDPVPVFLSCCIVNIWLGIPFMTVVFLGGLQSISKSYYEAAAIDGASRWQQFTQITLPMLKPVVVPSITLGTIWTFNNVNVIYLMTGQDGGNEYADILVTALYKSAFTYSRFSFSAAFAMVICTILLVITLSWIKISRAHESSAV